MKNLTFEQLYAEAEMVSELIHNNQTYDEIFPYKKHIKDVVGVLEEFGFSGNHKIAGYLHDGIEDGFLTYNKIKKAFGEDVAEMVLACTDPSDERNREAKKARTYQKLIAYPRAIPVKLADRIANIRHGIRMGSDQLKMYRKEHPKFEATLKPYGDAECEKMWLEMEKLLSLETVK